MRRPGREGAAVAPVGAEARRLDVLRRHPWLPVLSLVAAAAVLRWVAWLRTAAMFNDGPLFLALARRMADGEWSAAVAHDYHPLYPLAIRLAYPLAGDWERAAAAVSALAGAAAVALLYRFLRDAFDARVALVGAALLAVHPYAINFSCDVQSDGLYLAFFLGAAAMLWRALADGRATAAAAAGALAGLAFLTRPEGVGVVVVALGFAAARVLRRRWPLPRALRWAAALSDAAVLVAAPYLVALRVHHGSWMLTHKKSLVAMIGLDAPEVGGARQRPVAAPGELAPGTAHAQTALAEAGALPGAAGLGAGIDELGRALIGVRYEMLALIFVGVFARRGRPGRVGAFAGAFLLLYATVILALLLDAGYVSRRHVLPPATLAFGYAAVGVSALGGGLLRALGRVAPWARFARPSAGAATGLALVLALCMPSNLSSRRADALPERRAAEWLRDHAEGPGAVAARKRRVAYYAGAPLVPVPRAPLPQLLEYLRRSHARYLIIEEETLAELTGASGDALEGLRLLHREGEAAHRAAVFEVLPGA